MKILFLDVDGVLTNDKYLSGNKDDIDTEDYTLQEVVNKQLCPDNVKCLNKLLSATDVQVVLSSSWRKFVQLSELCIGLNKNGLKKVYRGFSKGYSVN